MALNIKNEAVERLASELSRLTGETKTETIRRALEERRARLAYRVADGDRRARLWRFLSTEVWRDLPDDANRPLSKEEEEELLGYGPDGV